MLTPPTVERPATSNDYLLACGILDLPNAGVGVIGMTAINDGESQNHGRAQRPFRHVHDMGGLSVLFVMATEQEYGPHLQRLIAPLNTGVGPVEAAAVTAATLASLAHHGRLPDLVFSLGSAGSRTLDHAGIYQIGSVAYRDMDASPLGFERGVTPFLGEPAVLPIPHRLPDVMSASIATGASIVSGKRL